MQGSVLKKNFTPEAFQQLRAENAQLRQQLQSLQRKRSDNDAIDPFYANLISKDWRHIFPSTAAGSVPPHPWQDAD